MKDISYTIKSALYLDLHLGIDNQDRFKKRLTTNEIILAFQLLSTHRNYQIKSSSVEVEIIPSYI